MAFHLICFGETLVAFAFGFGEVLVALGEVFGQKYRHTPPSTNVTSPNAARKCHHQMPPKPHQMSGAFSPFAMRNGNGGLFNLNFRKKFSQ